MKNSNLPSFPPRQRWVNVARSVDTTNPSNIACMVISLVFGIDSIACFSMLFG